MKLSYLSLAVLAVAALTTSGFMTRPVQHVEARTASIALTSDQLKSTKAAGSTCRQGCNEPNKICSDSNGHCTQIWYEHYECGWSSGSDTCSPGADTWCNKRYFYDSFCDHEMSSDTTWTSTCGPSLNMPLPVEITPPH